MNIFLMVLVAIFMLGYYIIDSPSLRVPEIETEYAARRADLHAIAQCAAAVHNAQIKGTTFDDVCVAQNQIVSRLFCMNASMKEIECKIVKNKKPTYSYIITATGALNPDEYNSMFEILEQYYADAGTFGILMDGKIVSGAIGSKYTVPKNVMKTMELGNGQLVYMTQYDITNITSNSNTNTATDIKCPTGTIKTYRFGRWQCIGINTKTDCGGDMIWDSDLLECVADESRKPLCASQQTAVIVDDVWECINPFPTKSCPEDMVAHLNYDTLEWECIADATKGNNITKCSRFTSGAIYGSVGATLRASQTSCTPCEKMILDTDTCTSYCIPDASKLGTPECYADTRQCSGRSRAFYFGFPNKNYAGNIPEMSGKNVPIDRTHNQNRRFNCLDCGDGEIDTEKSFAPYTAVCK